MSIGIMKLFDKLIITDQETTSEGHLRVKARLSRTGVQEYLLSEFNPTELPSALAVLPGDSIVRLNRPAEEVFKPESLATMVEAPVTDGHPPQFVNDENRGIYSRGVTVGSPFVDGDFVAAELLITDQNLIDKVKAGIRQISLGYNLDTEWKTGVDETYGVYDGVQRNIRVNHVAILAQGRGGPRVRIADKHPNSKEIRMTTRLIDGISVEFNDQGAEVVDKLQSSIEALRTESAKSKQEALDASAKAENLEGELAVKDAKIAELEAMDLDALVTARLTVIDEARKLVEDLDPAGKSLHEIKVEAIKARDEALDLDGKSEDFVEGVFRAMLAAKPEKKSAMDKALVDAAQSKADTKDARTAGLELLRKNSAVKAWNRKDTE